MTLVEDNTLDFNFWPSFSDLMLTLVLILVIVVFVVIASFPKEEPKPIPIPGDPIPLAVKQNQEDMIKAIAKEYIAKQYDVELKEDTEENTFVISISLENGRSTKIKIKNEATLQRYSFSDQILFKPDKYRLNKEGENTLLIVGGQIKRKLEHFSEIQIQGHADPDPPAFEPSNLHLAAKRAIEVFKFLHKTIGIHPAEHLMSATSFGEYKPVLRSDKDSTYTQEKLEKHNDTKEEKAQNRRIEILLFYPSDQSN